MNDEMFYSRSGEEVFSFEKQKFGNLTGHTFGGSLRFLKNICITRFLILTRNNIKKISKISKKRLNNFVQKFEIKMSPKLDA